jgi:hypothetical protein
MVMDCLPGSVGIDLGMAVPQRLRYLIFKELVCIHVSLLAPLSATDALLTSILFSAPSSNIS